MSNQRLLLQLLLLLALFLLSLGFFLYLQSQPVFPDPDSFYHTKVALLMSRQGVVESFPWLAFTSLTEIYTDQHFLYHVFLLPFVTQIEPIFGAKLATTVINACLITLFAVFLLRSRVRWWLLPSVILLVTNPFLFRLNLVKAPGLSIILLLVGLWLLFQKRTWPLAVLGFVYVWTYGGFALLGLFAFLYAVVGGFHAWQKEQSVQSVFRRFHPRHVRWGKLFQNVRTSMLVATGGGLLAGLLINPYFPDNLFFYWQQLFQIGIVNFQDVVNVGGEWRPYGFIELLANTVFVSIAVLIALVAFAITRRRQTEESWMLLVITVFFFLITLKSRRYVELYVPFALLFASFSLRDALAGRTWRWFWEQVASFSQRHVLISVLLAVYFLATSLTVVVRDLRQLDRDLKNGFSANYLAGASRWLRENTPERSIVVHSDWDEFPPLFYHNDHNRYIVGLDPTFMYQWDRVLYERWADLTTGQRREEATTIITQDLLSNTVLVTKDHGAFEETMRRQEAFQVVYEDEEAKIYQLKELPGP